MTLSMVAAILIIPVMGTLLAIFLARYRGQSPDVFVPKATWSRAGTYFCACYLVAIGTGLFDALVSNIASTILTTNLVPKLLEFSS